MSARVTVKFFNIKSNESAVSVDMKIDVNILMT